MLVVNANQPLHKEVQAVKPNMIQRFHLAVKSNITQPQQEAVGAVGVVVKTDQVRKAINTI